MFWKKWQSKKNIINDPLSIPSQSKDRKFIVSDIWFIVILSTILAILTFYSATAQFYDLERGNAFASKTGIILITPLYMVSLPLYFFAEDSRDPYGAALGMGILIEFLSPVFAFIFWFIIFWLLAKFGKKFVFKKGNFFWKHALSFAIVLVIISPYVYYSFGSNEVDACLSGALNSEDVSGSVPGLMEARTYTVGPEFCFKNILDKFTYSPLSKEAVNFCTGLSVDKIVWGTNESYKDYCIYAIGGNLNPVNNTFADDFEKTYLPNLPASSRSWAIYVSKLCDIYGSSTNSESTKTRCLIHFLDAYLSGQNNEGVIKIFCEGIPNQSQFRQCTVIPDQLSVSVKVNGSHNPTDIKLNSEIVVSWEAIGAAKGCTADGTFTPRADGKGKWGIGEYHLLPLKGSMTLIANSSLLAFHVQCAPDPYSVFYSARDSVTVNVVE